MEFRGVLELGGKTATGVEVPAEVVAALGGGKRPPVAVTINGFTYRTTVAPMGGRFLVPVSAEVRAAAGVRAGDHVDVVVALDTEPRTVELPTDLARALATPGLRAAWDQLSYTRRKEYARGVDAAKKPETRQRRVEAVVADLGAG